MNHLIKTSKPPNEPLKPTVTRQFTSRLTKMSSAVLDRVYHKCKPIRPLHTSKSSVARDPIRRHGIQFMDSHKHEQRGQPHTLHLSFHPFSRLLVLLSNSPNVSSSIALCICPLPFLPLPVYLPHYLPLYAPLLPPSISPTSTISLYLSIPLPLYPPTSLSLTKMITQIF